MTHRRTQLAVLATLMIGFSAAASPASLITDYFDNYGTVDIDRLNGLNGGTGWAGAWFDSSVGNVGNAQNPGYAANVQTSFVNANYTGGGESGGNDGRALVSSGDNAGALVRRTFSTALTGTIWISALVRHEIDTAGDVLLWFETTGSGSFPNTFVGLRNGDKPTLRYNGANTQAADLNTAGSDLLLLAKIELDYSGANDRVSLWIKTESADLSSEGALGGALLSAGTADLFGSSLSFIALSGGNQYSNIDNLRIADGPGALTAVLTGVAVVPAPAALPAGLGLLSLMTLRRRRRL